MIGVAVVIVLWFAAVGAQAQPMTLDMAEARASYLRSLDLAELEAVNGPYSVPHNPHATLPPRGTPYTGSDVVERWRPLIEVYFEPGDVDWALAIVACESGGIVTAKNPGSSASGLFQHLARYWPQRSKLAGWEGASIWDPEANIAVAAWLLEKNGKASWVCKA